jgi:hypothetical protein
MEDGLELANELLNKPSKIKATIIAEMKTTRSRELFDIAIDQIFFIVASTLNCLCINRTRAD